MCTFVFKLTVISLERNEKEVTWWVMFTSDVITITYL